MSRHWYLLADLLILVSAVAVGYWARFEGGQWQQELATGRPFVALSTAITMLGFWVTGVYRVVWRHAASRDFVRLGAAGAVAGGINLLLGVGPVVWLGVSERRIPMSVLAFLWLATVLGPASLRALERMLFVASPRGRGQRGRRPERRARRVLVIGAGEAGRLIVEEFRRAGAGERLIPVGFLDSDPAKHNRTVAGLPVYGGHEMLAEVVEVTGANEMVIAMPSAPGDVVRRLTDAAREIDLAVRTLPGLVEIASGRISTSSLRKVDITDLLRREPVHTDMDAVRALIAGRRVLVTGAGGSIGSELCRQVARCEPAVIGLLGHGENSIFEIEGELRRRFEGIVLEPIIADIRHRARLDEVFGAFAPEMVFHAAAHKHVPLMERNPAEAVTNNIAGTWNVTELAAQHGVQRLVMISTDKAVRPTSVMGASKRVAEQLVQELAHANDCNFVAVRFGNVLGSRGSVVPTFLRQLAEGGPLTLTHPEMRRYFMTIPEAVQLVLQASVLGQGGEIFALDMGKAVRIADLATDLIRLSGLEPGRDVEIVFTGLRPGEKMYEEVFFDGEGITPTSHPKILHTATTATPGGLISLVRLMEVRANAGADADELRSYLMTLVPDYVPQLADLRRGLRPTPPAQALPATG